MLKWALRIGGVLLVLIVVAFAVMFTAYSMWMSGQKSALLKGSQIASTRLGDIEYAIVGEGEPRLAIHGTPGGYDQSRIFADVYAEDLSGVQTIAVSRPGYLRTPLSSGETPEQQADLYAALLDKLGIERAVVEGSSGGAPSAVQFAIRHPERTTALVLVVPLLEPWTGDFDPRPPEQFLIEQNVVTWLMGDRLADALAPEADERQMQMARKLVRTQIPAGLRVDGMVNDTLQFRKMDIDAWALESIRAPTLILHGDADRNAPYKASVAAAVRIHDARLETFEGGDHFIVVTRAKDILARVRRFLFDITGQPQPASI